MIVLAALLVSDADRRGPDLGRTMGLEAVGVTGRAGELQRGQESIRIIPRMGGQDMRRKAHMSISLASSFASSRTRTAPSCRARRFTVSKMPNRWM